MKELLSVGINEDGAIMVQSSLPKDDLKTLLSELLENINEGKTIEIESDDNDKPKYLA